MTPLKEASVDSGIKKKLLKSDVKLLFESQLMQIDGEGEVEKVRINDLNENQEYELFMDAVVIPSRITSYNVCYTKLLRIH